MIILFPFELFVKERLSQDRFIHSVNVAKAAKNLALKYGASEEKAVIAGMLHDITKEWTNHEHMQFLNQHNIGLTGYEYTSAKLFHAITGACFSKVTLKINDIDIFNAIRFHTTARNEMSILEKIIYVSDFISEDRQFKDLETLRVLAYKSLEAAVGVGVKLTMMELVKNGYIIHPDTFNAYNEMMFLKSKCAKAFNKKNEKVVMN